MSDKPQVYRLLRDLPKHKAGETWELRDNECVFITSLYDSTSEYVPSSNWEPYFLRDNPDWFTPLPPAETKCPCYKTIYHLLHHGGTCTCPCHQPQPPAEEIEEIHEDNITDLAAIRLLGDKLNEVIQAVNRLSKRGEG